MWPSCLCFTCCLDITAQLSHSHQSNSLIASINKDDWGQKSPPRLLDVSVCENYSKHCVSVCVFSEPHSTAAVNKHATNECDDCDVNHSCIKAMSHSPKAAIISIKT